MVKSIREEFYYPIVIPLDENGNGPASIESGEARRLTWEVWDKELMSHASFDNLHDAIDEVNKLNAALTA